MLARIERGMIVDVFAIERAMAIDLYQPFLHRLDPIG
jgi:hypothetical protein